MIIFNIVTPIKLHKINYQIYFYSPNYNKMKKFSLVFYKMPQSRIVFSTFVIKAYGYILLQSSQQSDTLFSFLISDCRILPLLETLYCYFFV
jgi:hypothetical protein